MEKLPMLNSHTHNMTNTDKSCYSYSESWWTLSKNTAEIYSKYVLTVPLMTVRHIIQIRMSETQRSHVTRWPQGKNAALTSFLRQILHRRASFSIRFSASKISETNSATVIHKEEMNTLNKNQPVSKIQTQQKHRTKRKKPTTWGR